MKITPPPELTDVVSLALEDLEDPREMINGSAEFILIMRRQDIDGNDEVLPYTSEKMSPSVVAGMLQLAQFQILNGMFQPYEDDDDF